jgi:hypothetical protein
MDSSQGNNAGKPAKSNFPAAGTGNASNPSPHSEKIDPANSRQLLNEDAEKYLRESGNIEDLPDAQDEQEMDETMNRESK